MAIPRFNTVKLEKAQSLKESIKILLVTATDIETKALHSHFRPLYPHRSCFTVPVGNQTYYIGRLGNYAVVHVQCQMGSATPGGSINTVSEALDFWNVKAVIMVGIAFGIDSEKQCIGDILISKTVIPYEIKKVGTCKTIHRNVIAPCSTKLLNRFTNSKDWKYKSLCGQNVAVTSEHLLSGETLIDNVRFRDKLLKSFPQAAGGEMEGSGVFSAAHQKGIDWILVKGICDFADGKKSTGKRKKQEIAAFAAASFCCHVFSKANVFEALNCHDIKNNKRQTKGPITQQLDSPGVLFEIYEPGYESAYLERTIDTIIHTRLKRKGIWISGPSGCGKTNALRRALYVDGTSFHSIDLSKCVGSSMPELFCGLYMELADAFGINDPSGILFGKPKSYYIKEIIQLLRSNFKQDTYVLIDEIPIDSVDNFKEFTDGITAILIGLANQGGEHGKFALMSIHEAKGYIKPFQKKIFEYLYFINQSEWEQNEIQALLVRITKLLRLKLNKDEQAKIISAAQGSPRQLKSIVRTYLLFSSSANWTIDKVIAESCNQ